MLLNLNKKTDRKKAYKDLIFSDHGFLRYKFSNHHGIGKEMYRENQPSPKRIKEWKDVCKKNNIKIKTSTMNKRKKQNFKKYRGQGNP